jgi:NhaP-type Na+/H+ or K+/H+ antiporter
LKIELLAPLVFLTQGVGLVFFVVFVSAYFGGMPSSGNLIGNSAFRVTLSVLGGVFLILILGVLLAAVLARKKNSS